MYVYTCTRGGSRILESGGGGGGSLNVYAGLLLKAAALHIHSRRETMQA